MIATQTAIEAKERRMAGVRELAAAAAPRVAAEGEIDGDLPESWREYRETLLWLRREKVSMRELSRMLKMVVREHLTFDAIMEVVKAAEYLDDLARKLECGPEAMRAMLMGALAAERQLAGKAMKAGVLVDLAERILAAPPGPGVWVPPELVRELPVRRDRIGAGEVLMVVLAPASGLPWTAPVAETLVRLRSNRRADDLVMVRSMLVWLMRRHTELSYPEINRVLRGHEHGHSTCVEQMKWMMTHWGDWVPAGWRAQYRTMGDLLAELDTRCTARHGLRPEFGMEAMEGVDVFAECAGQGGEDEGEAGAEQQDSEVQCG